jgi:hypothetical protein
MSILIWLIINFYVLSVLGVLIVCLRIGVRLYVVLVGLGVNIVYRKTERRRILLRWYLKGCPFCDRARYNSKQVDSSSEELLVSPLGD